MPITHLRGREEIASGTLAFHFDKPAGFDFKAGQAIDLVLPQPPGTAEDSTRHTFSIVSAPCENEIVIATRMRDSLYKHTLEELPVGSALSIEGPSGSLVLHKDKSRPAVFIAGGIGITPFMSMLRQAAHDRLDQRLVLVYSNRRPEDSAFLTELQQLERQYRMFSLVATMTQMSESKLPWSGETSMVDAALLMKVASELVKPVYYVAGPPAMVEAMRKTLDAAGVDDLDIRSEDFYGY